jgi:cobalamin biosynthesis Co2+ chelatase CbiK
LESNIIINKLKERDGINADTPTEALEKMIEPGITEYMFSLFILFLGLNMKKLRKL